MKVILQITKSHHQKMTLPSKLRPYLTEVKPQQEKMPITLSQKFRQNMFFHHDETNAKAIFVMNF